MTRAIALVAAPTLCYVLISLIVEAIAHAQ